MLIGLARHAHAEKNSQLILGGSGTGLTPLGRQQAQHLAEKLAVRFANAPVISVNRGQCLETAAVIANVTRGAIIVCDIAPFSLGDADGLTAVEMSCVMPEVAKRFELWNAGEIDINQLDIPNAGDPLSYYGEGRTFLSVLSERNQRVVLVATRSVLVMLWNVILGNDPKIHGAYRHVPWDNAELRVKEFIG